jgi:N-succinyldiaminopimelate aminotransferase
MRTVMARKLAGLGTSVFSEMTQLALAHGAVNLAQGFPDFDGPEALKDAAVRAIREGHNQYARSSGTPPLHETIAMRYERDYGLVYRPAHEITVGAGATELLFGAVNAVCDIGDEVILLEPFYDSYRAAVALAGAVVRTVRLEPPSFALPREALVRALSPRTRVLILNNPHNPTGKCFDDDELKFIAKFCIDNDILCIADEVYEHIRFEGPHRPIAALPGMRERTFTLSSLSKSFSMTGFRVGFCVADAPLSAALQTVHQFVTFAAPTPFQQAAADPRLWDPAGFAALRDELRQKRDRLGGALADLGFDVYWPSGTYFLCAGFSRWGAGGDDVAFARFLTERIKVAAIPPSAFLEEAGTRLPYVRFVFCKRDATLDEAIRRLQTLRSVGSVPGATPHG